MVLARSGRRWLLAAMLVTSVACGGAPDKEMLEAQGAIDSATAAGANEYAREELDAAKTALERAHTAVDARDYRLALNQALDSRERAQNAAREATDHRAMAQAAAESGVEDLAASVADTKARLATAEGTGPNASGLVDARRVVGEAEHALQEARTLLSEGRYAEVTESLRRVSERLKDAAKRLEPAAGGASNTSR